MGFKRARAAVVDRLKAGNYGHWPRDDLFLKNWLAAGRITEGEVVRLLVRCRGDQYRPGSQQSPSGTEVHEFFPEDGGVRWYIKAYLDHHTGEATVEAVFMSVHPSGA